MSDEYSINPIAEGPSEFRANPEDVMDLLGGSLPLVENRKQVRTLENDPTVKGPTSSDKEAMKELLMKFHKNAENTVDTSLRSEEGKKIQRAMITESNQGREWHVQINEQDEVKYYSIFNDYTKKAFFEDLALYETAKKICQLLENGNALNSEKIQKVLYYDKVYESNYAECSNLKRLHKKAKLMEDRSKMHILQDKFESSREKALQAKKAIKMMR